MHRVYCQEIPAVGSVVELEEREKEHLFKVFRASVGEQVGLLDGKGSTGTGEVVAGKQIQVLDVQYSPEPECKLYLCCALPRKQKLDSLLKQATELGAWCIQPVRCERSVACGDPKERWELHFREACKQSGNPYMPQMNKEVSLPQLLDELNRQGIAIYYGSVTPKAIIPGSSVPGAKALLIGPEGGFSDREIAMIEEKGGIGINFAPHVLRLETAAIAGLTLLRFISLLVLCVAGFALTGCGQGDISKNPLMVKAEKLREAGDTAASRRYYRQAVARYPENPEVYFALGRLCDEELDDPYEALYCYRSFLQLAPQDDERRADVEKLLTRLEQRIVGRTVAASEAFIALQKENKKLSVQNKNLRKQLHDSKMYIIRRERQLQKNVSGRNGK